MTIIKKAFIRCAVKIKLLHGRHPTSDFIFIFGDGEKKSVEKGQEKERKGNKGGRGRRWRETFTQIMKLNRILPVPVDIQRVTEIDIVIGKKNVPPMKIYI